MRATGGDTFDLPPEPLFLSSGLKADVEAYGEHMYDRRGSRRRSATENNKFLSLRIHFYQVMSKRTYSISLRI